MADHPPTTPDVPPDPASASIAHAATSVLTWGFRLAAMLFVIGLGLLVIRDDPVPSSLAPLPELLDDVGAGRAIGFLGLSILTIIVTPLVTAMVAVVNFARLYDRRYAVVAGVVLSLLGIAIGMAIF